MELNQIEIFNFAIVWATVFAGIIAWLFKDKIWKKRDRD